MCRYVLYCIVCIWCYFYALPSLALLVWERDIYKSVPCPIIQVTLMDKSSMASKKFIVPVSKLKVDGMVVCCVSGWSWSCYMQVGLTLPSCSLMIVQKWPYIPLPRVYDVICITLHRLQLFICKKIHVLHARLFHAIFTWLMFASD